MIAAGVKVQNIPINLIKPHARKQPIEGGAA